MREPSKYFAIVYCVITSVTVLVMLTATFELFEKKYFPSFMLAQKYVLPLILSAMTVVFLTFFEPERLAQRNSILFVRIVMSATLIIFSYYISTLNIGETTALFLIIAGIQWIASAAGTVYFFRFKKIP